MHNFHGLINMSDNEVIELGQELCDGKNRILFNAEIPAWFINQIVSFSHDVHFLDENTVEIAALIPVTMSSEIGRKEDIILETSEFFTDGDQQMIEGNLMNAFQVAANHDEFASGVLGISVCKDLVPYRMLEIAMKSSMKSNDIALRNILHSDYRLREDSDIEAPEVISAMPGIDGFYCMAIKLNVTMDKQAFLKGVKTGQANLLMSYRDILADKIFAAVNTPHEYAMESTFARFIEDLLTDKLVEYGLTDVYTGWMMPLSCFPRNLSTILCYTMTILKLENEGGLDAESRYSGDFAMRVIELPYKVVGEMFSEGNLVWRCCLPNKRWSTGSAHYESRMIRRIIDLRYACDVVIARSPVSDPGKINWMRRFQSD